MTKTAEKYPKLAHEKTSFVQQSREAAAKLDPEITKTQQPLVLQSMLKELEFWLIQTENGINHINWPGMQDTLTQKTTKFERVLVFFGDDFLYKYYHERKMTELQLRINNMYRKSYELMKKIFKYRAFQESRSVFLDF